MNTAYLILGSNLGGKVHNLQQAIQLIKSEIGVIVKISGVFATAAWGNTSQPDFVNQAVCVDTALSSTDLLHSVLAIEKKLGRVRDQQKWKERIIDIDILFYNESIITAPDLIIPHPWLQERLFVLIPLLEIAPEYIHPVFIKNISTLIDECKDTLEVKRLEV